MNNYTYEEVLFVVEEARRTYELIFEMSLRSKFPVDYKKKIYKLFVQRFGHTHPFNSIKPLIDNILSNWNIEGYTKFGKGSSLVRELAGTNWRN